MFLRSASFHCAVVAACQNTLPPFSEGLGCRSVCVSVTGVALPERIAKDFEQYALERERVTSVMHRGALAVPTDPTHRVLDASSGRMRSRYFGFVTVEELQLLGWKLCDGAVPVGYFDRQMLYAVQPGVAVSSTVGKEEPTIALFSSMDIQPHHVDWGIFFNSDVRHRIRKFTPNTAANARGADCPTARETLTLLMHLHHLKHCTPRDAAALAAYEQRKLLATPGCSVIEHEWISLTDLMKRCARVHPDAPCCLLPTSSTGITMFHLSQVLP
jgi:hypothetical protein